MGIHKVFADESRKKKSKEGTIDKADMTQLKIDKNAVTESSNDSDVFHGGLKMPTYADLDYPEITISMGAMKAGSFQLGIYCLDQCREFMLCRHEEQDPRKCISEGKAVTKCGLEFFHKIKNVGCKEDFDNYFRCIHHSGRLMDLSGCRKTQKAFDKCVEEKLGISRPPVGYYTSAHGHDTDRPKPVREKPHFPNPTAGLPENYPMPEAWHGGRSPFWV